MILKKNPQQSLFSLHLAVRDGRRSAGFLVTYALLLAFGLAILVAARATVSSVQGRLAESSRELAGGDIIISAKRPIPGLPVVTEGTQIASEIRLRTMATFSGRSQLTQVRAVDSAYPLYGGIETSPDAHDWRGKGEAIVESTLLERLGLRVGDEIEVLGIRVRVGSVLVSAPGDLSIGTIVAPRIYLARALVPEAILTQRGSLVEYLTYIKIPDDSALEGNLTALRKELPPRDYEISTHIERTRQASRVVEWAAALCGMVAIAATLLTLVATAGTMNLYLLRKFHTAALLRCLGAKRRQIRGIFALQIVSISLIASCSGLALGAVIHYLLLNVIERHVRYTFEYGVTMSLVLQIISGVAVVSLWSVAPVLAALSAASPIAVLRDDISVTIPMKWRIVSMSSALLALLGWWLLRGAERSDAYMAGGAIGAICASWIVTFFLLALLRRISRFIKHAPVRLGLKSLFRPGNQTGMVLSSTILAFVLSTAVSVLGASLDTFRLNGIRGDSPNMFLYELEPDQADRAAELIRMHGGHPAQQLPVILMRINSLKGTPVTQLLEKGEIPRWTLGREYWVSYRSELQDNEEIVAGEWIGKVDGVKGPIPISVDAELAGRLGVELGDSIEWDIQGVPLETYVASLRTIIWQRFERNSFVVFPEGVLEGAPHFLFWSLQVPSSEQRTLLTAQLAKEMPNASIIDLTTIITRISELLEGVGYAVQALVGIILIVAATLVIVTTFGARRARLQELFLLKELGMRRHQMRIMMVVEAATLGVVSATVGVGLGCCLGWYTATMLFKTTPTIPILPILFVGVAGMFLFLLVGLLPTGKVRRERLII